MGISGDKSQKLGITLRKKLSPEILSYPQIVDNFRLFAAQPLHIV